MATERERILAQAGDPLSLNEVRGEQAEQTTQTLKYSPEVFLEFGRQIMSLLSQSRQLGTAPFVEEELSARERMAEEVLKPAEAGMPPTLQQRIRSAEVSSLEPLLTGARERRQTFAEQLRGFGTALEQARALGTTLASLEQRVLENQLTAKQEARKTIESMYKLGGKQAFSHLDDKEKRKWEALAGLPKGFIDALPEVETEKWEIKTVGNKVLRINPQTGEAEVLYSAPEKPETTIKDVTIGGKLYRQLIDKNTGQVLQQFELGIAGKPSAEMMKQANNAKSGLRALATLESEINRSPDVIWKAEMPGFVGRIAAGKYRSARDEAADVITRLRTGAAINANEERFYKEQLPKVGDSPETISYKINKLKNLFKTFADPWKTYGLFASKIEVDPETIEQAKKYLEPGKILVLDRKTQQIGQIEPEEFDIYQYELLDY